MSNDTEYKSSINPKHTIVTDKNSDITKYACEPGTSKQDPTKIQRNVLKLNHSQSENVIATAYNSDSTRIKYNVGDFKR